MSHGDQLVRQREHGPASLAFEAPLTTAPASIIDSGLPPVDVNKRLEQAVLSSQLAMKASDVSFTSLHLFRGSENNFAQAGSFEALRYPLGEGIVTQVTFTPRAPIGLFVGSDGKVTVSVVEAEDKVRQVNVFSQVDGQYTPKFSANFEDGVATGHLPTISTPEVTALLEEAADYAASLIRTGAAVTVERRELTFSS
jgi:hypothetical protein